MVTVIQVDKSGGTKAGFDSSPVTPDPMPTPTRMMTARIRYDLEARMLELFAWPRRTRRQPDAKSGEMVLYQFVQATTRNADFFTTKGARPKCFRHTFAKTEPRVGQSSRHNHVSLHSPERVKSLFKDLY